MDKANREVLLHPGSLSDASRVFEIPVGGELTFVALGLQDEDYVYFELVYAPSIEQEACACPPPTVTPPVVTIKEVLRIDGEPVILRKNNPFCVITAPQGQPMRAVRRIKNPEDLIDFRLTMQYTDTKPSNYWLTGIKPGFVVDDSVGIGDSIEGA